MDMVPVHLHTSVIKRYRCGPTGTIGFHMAGFRVKRLNQRGFSCSKCPENYNLAFFIISHYEKM
jgi:hypothetical protein